MTFNIFICHALSAGIDISKDKSTVCILASYGNFIKKPFIINTKESINKLALCLLAHQDMKRDQLNAFV